MISTVFEYFINRIGFVDWTRKPDTVRIIISIGKCIQSSGTNTFSR